MIKLIVYIYSLILGYVTAKILTGQHSHERGVLRSLLIPIRGRRLHLHHWMMGLFIINMLVFAKVLLNKEISNLDFLVIWFLIGVIAHGIMYDDWKQVWEIP